MSGLDDWVRCPDCGCEDVTAYVLPHEVYLSCTECGAIATERVPRTVGAADGA